MQQAVRLNASASLYADRPDLFNSAAIGIRDVMIIQGREPQISTGGQNTASAISRFEVQSYNNSRQQVDINIYLLNLGDDTDVASNRTADFIITDRDMYAEGTNFVFGSTLFDWQLSIQSVARFIKATRDEALQNRLTQHIARHEFAHLSGMNKPSNYANPDKRGGIYSGHCANMCTLQQANSVTEAINQVERLGDDGIAGFCLDCVKAIWLKANPEQ